jgi:phosphate-selective porin OprO/OprP
VRHFTRPFIWATAVTAGWAMPAQAQTAEPAPKPAASSSSGEWTVKPRGRLQLDYGNVSGPSLDLAANQAELGPDTRVRRAYLGVDLTAPGGKFGARLEADFASNPITLTDAYLFYKPRKELTLTAGHHKAFWGLEELTSDNYSSFQERAAYSSAFGFERRLGLSAAYVGKEFLVQAGVFADDATALGFPDSGTAIARDIDDAYSVDARAVYMPKLGKGQLHLGGSIHYRDMKSLETVRYRARPFVRTTDIRFVDTRNITGTGGELGLGLEAAYIHGPFHATAETFWQKALRPGQVSPTFNGGYAELGYNLTGEKTAYKGGTYDRLAPKKPLGKGIGAVQVNLRYDWLDLNSGAIVGGRQDMAGVSLVWVPLTHLRFIADYGHYWIQDSPVTANGGQRDYEVDGFGLRAQFDF